MLVLSKKQFVSLLALILLLVGIANAQAWTGPSQSAPNGNVSAPINVGTTDQVKNAGLGVNSLAVFGNSILSGASRYLNWGTVSGSTGYGIRDNAGVMEVKSSGGSWTAIAGGSGSQWITSGTNIYYTTGNVGIGTTSPTSRLTVRGTAHITNPGNTTNIELGNGQTANNYAFIDLVGDTTYPDYGLRLIRGNAGANSANELVARGTSGLGLVAQDAAPVTIRTTNAERLRVDASGNVGIGTNAPAFELAIGDTDTGFNWLSDGNLALYTNNVERVRFDSSGNVGIGNAAPGHRLDVTGNIRASGEHIGTLGSGSGQFRMVAGNYGAMFRNDGTNTYFLLTASGDQYGVWNALRPFTINDATGNVSIGTQLAVTGNVTAAGFFHSSDARLKENISTLDGMGILNNIRGVSFNWKKDGSSGAGVIAQDVETVLPSAVHTDADGMKSVDYDQLIGVLIQAVKEQQAQIDSLKYEIESLKRTH